GPAASDWPRQGDRGRRGQRQWTSAGSSHDTCKGQQGSLFPISRLSQDLRKPLMEADIKLAFDILAFISVMVLIVLGLGVIASMMGIFNFAHGEFVLLGAYTVYLFQSSGLSAWAGIFAAPVVLALVGLVLERLVIRRFYAAPIIAMLGTYAIGLVIRETVRGLLGGHYKSVNEPLPGAFTLLGIDFSTWRAFIIVITLLVIAGTWLFLARTSAGLQIRGSLENPMLA